MRYKKEYIMKFDKYITYIDYINMKSNNIINNYFLKNKIKKYNLKYMSNEINKTDFKNLSLEQKMAVVCDEENILLLAGAGCGKTYTIASKIKYLVEEKNINEKEILCLSFTNKSVLDLKRKIEYDVDIYTFHKLSLEILSDYKYMYNICDSAYLNYIVNELLYKYDLGSLNNTIVRFIDLFIMNEIPFSYLEKISKKNTFLRLIKTIYIVYENEKLSSGLLDFNDMINKCIHLIEKNGLKRYYKYIIIDEYQDISLSRYKLINKIKESCNSHIFSVGDDFQSIYNFSGANTNMIYKYNKFFKHSKILYLTNTYRNSIELIKLSSKFIMKNKRQIKKELKSIKSIDRPVKIIYYKKNLKVKFKKIIEEIDNILILTRNKFDIELLKDNDIEIFNEYIIYKNKKIKYLTVHKAKGLEEENVVILNLIDSVLGFPNKITDSEAFKYVFKPADKLEEERRLFYVALTRCKDYCFLFVDKDKPSKFINEIIKESKNYIEVLDL